MSVSRFRRVAVIGPSDAREDSADFSDAERVGKLLAAYEGVVTVTGGLFGVMKAASRGAAEHGGLTLGFLPGTSVDDANDWVRIAIPTGMGEARNILVVGSAEAVICVGGSWGTLSEVALARRRRVPLASVRGWRVVGDACEVVNEFEDSDGAVEWVATQIGLNSSGSG